MNIPSESVKINFVYSDSAVLALIRGTWYVLIDACVQADRSMKQYEFDYKNIWNAQRA